LENRADFAKRGKTRFVKDAGPEIVVEVVAEVLEVGAAGSSVI
jgi:hypothetical protein